VLLEGTGEGGAEDGLRSLVCALKVGLIDSDFDPGRVTGAGCGAIVEGAVVGLV
jgi:hypothetical protein